MPIFKQERNNPSFIIRVSQILTDDYGLTITTKINNKNIDKELFEKSLGNIVQDFEYVRVSFAYEIVNGKKETISNKITKLQATKFQWYLLGAMKQLESSFTK